MLSNVTFTLQKSFLRKIKMMNIKSTIRRIPLILFITITMVVLYSFPLQSMDQDLEYEIQKKIEEWFDTYSKVYSISKPLLEKLREEHKDFYSEFGDLLVAIDVYHKFLNAKDWEAVEKIIITAAGKKLKKVAPRFNTMLGWFGWAKAGMELFKEFVFDPYLMGEAIETYSRNRDAGFDRADAVINIRAWGNIEQQLLAKFREEYGDAIFSDTSPSGLVLLPRWKANFDRFVESHLENEYLMIKLKEAQQKAQEEKARLEAMKLEYESRILQMLEALAEAEKPEEVDTTVVSIIIRPGSVLMEIGETMGFEAMAVLSDNSVQSVTPLAAWTGGSANSFTAMVPGNFEISATYTGISGSARIEVACPDGLDWNTELSKCTSLDEAIDEIAEEEEFDDELCNEVFIEGYWRLIRENVARSAGILSSFNVKQQKFFKAIHDQNSGVCNNVLLAAAYAGAQRDLSRYQDLVEQVEALSAALILNVGLCPDLSFTLDTHQLVTELGKLGGSGREIKNGIASMQSQLEKFGCDEQEVEELGNQIAENTADPEVIEEGGSGGKEICGDGIDNNGNGLIDEGCEAFGNFNVVALLYDSGSLPDDAFTLSISGLGNLGVTPVGGARTYPLNLAPGTYTATVTVILAPDDIGTFTLTIYQGEQIILGPVSGGPPQGTQISYEFTVTDATPIASGAGLNMMFDQRIVFYDEGETMSNNIFNEIENIQKRGNHNFIDTPSKDVRKREVFDNTNRESYIDRQQN